MLRRTLFALPLLMLLAPLSAAAQSAGFDFGGKAPILLDVATIDVESTYTPPMRDPYVDHLIPVTPTDAVRLWVTARLKAGGTQGRARVIIHDASVKEQALERTSGVKGWFTKDQSEKYEGKIQVEIVVDGTSRGFGGSASALVGRSTTVEEDVSLAEREKTMLALVRDLAADLDSQVDPAIRSSLFPVVIIR